MTEGKDIEDIQTDLSYRDELLVLFFVTGFITTLLLLITIFVSYKQTGDYNTLFIVGVGSIVSAVIVLLLKLDEYINKDFEIPTSVTFVMVVTGGALTWVFIDPFWTPTVSFLLTILPKVTVSVLLQFKQNMI